MKITAQKVKTQPFIFYTFEIQINMTTQEEINILIGANKLLESDDLNGIVRALIISRINDVIASLELKETIKNTKQS